LAVPVGCLLLLVSEAGAGGRDNPRPGHKNRPARSRNSAYPREAAKRSRTQLYRLGPVEIRALEMNDMFTIAKKMYGFGEGRSAAVYNEIARIEAQRWDHDPAIGRYVELLTKRSQLYGELLVQSKRQGRADVPAIELRRNKGFTKILRNIRLFERRHPHRFINLMNRIEPLLDPAGVELAHRQWRKRAAAVRPSVKIGGLLAGLSTKRFKKPPHAAVVQNPGSQKNPRHAKRGSEGGNPKAAARRAKTLNRRTPRRAASPARPLSDWEKYVRDFIKRYDLTPSQTNAALSILKELTSRAVQIEKANRDQQAAAERITDAKERRRRLLELSKPVEGLFGELNRRLDGLLTAAQRQKTRRK